MDDDASWRASLKRDTAKARQARSERSEVRQRSLVGIQPPTKYLGVRLTPSAADLLRLVARDLFAEGMVMPIFKRLYEREPAVQAKELHELLRLYCVEDLTIKQVAKVRQMPVAVTKRRLTAAFHVLLTYAEPKRLRDQLWLIALGRREPHLTYEEISRIMGWKDQYAAEVGQ